MHKKWEFGRKKLEINQSSIDETFLFFNSRFISGNLEDVVRTSPNEFSLSLSPDPYTDCFYTQWYFFSVKNLGKDWTVTFSIKNLIKPESLYNLGMKPLVWSVK